MSFSKNVPEQHAASVALAKLTLERVKKQSITFLLWNSLVFELTSGVVWIVLWPPSHNLVVFFSLDAVKKPWERSNSADKSSLVSRWAEKKSWKIKYHLTFKNWFKIRLINNSLAAYKLWILRVWKQKPAFSAFYSLKKSLFFQSETDWQHQWSGHRVRQDETGFY